MVRAGGAIHDSSTSARRPPAGRGGHTPTLPVSDCPEMYTSGVSRQEEHAQLPRRSRLIVPFRNACTADSRRGLGPLDIPLELRPRDDMYKLSRRACQERGEVFFACGTLPHRRCARVPHPRDMHHARCARVPQPRDIAPRPMCTCPAGVRRSTTTDVDVSRNGWTLHHGRCARVPQPRDIAPPPMRTSASGGVRRTNLDACRARPRGRSC
jgi:hypothetical protein